MTTEQVDKAQNAPRFLRLGADSTAVRRRGMTPFAIATAITLVIAFLSVGLGSVYIAPHETFKILLSHVPFFAITADWSSTSETILFDIRLPRVALIALAGLGLSSSGAAYQGLFRNPLADPYLIGVAAGAGLGAVGVTMLQALVPGMISPLGVPIGAFAGGLCAVVIVYSLARIGGSVPTTTLILAGVAVGAFATQVMTLMLLRLGEQSSRVLAFLLGGHGAANWTSVLAVTPFMAVGFGLMYLYARPLNLLLLDENQAQQLGVDVVRVKVIVVVAATLATASAVAFTGLIGFVGLIVPHVARFFVGPDHRRLLPMSAVAGAGFLMLADLFARTVIAPEELPLGMVTAFAGAPFFVVLLRHVKHGAFV